MRNIPSVEKTSPKISIEIVTYIVDWLESRGFKTDELLRQSRISPAMLSSRENFIELAHYTHFFEIAAQHAEIPNLGLKAARFNDPGSLSALGYLFMSAPTLSDAVKYLCSHLGAFQDETFHRASLVGRKLHVEYRIVENSIIHRRQDAEYSIAVIDNLVRIYSGGNVRPVEVHFEHRCLNKYDDYWTHFGCDVFFDQKMNAVIYESDDFYAPCPARQSMLTKIISSHLEALAEGRAEKSETGARVRELIASGVSSEPVVADRLSISVSTLSRRLKAERLSFRRLLSEHRISNAKRMLLVSDRSVAEVALAVGYAESASFIRAFRRMSGVSPSQYRIGLN